MRLGAAPRRGSAAAAGALILAAGRGERMRPLTDRTPKPLLAVRGRPLVQRWVDALRAGGVERIVINTAWLGEQIEDYFGRERWSGGPDELSFQERPAIRFSAEGRDFGYALETAGGIARALPLLAAAAAEGAPGGAAAEVFWVVAGDIYAPGFAFSAEAAACFAASGRLAHLWLVPNPAHHPAGDFAIGPGGQAVNEAPAGGVRHTFSTIALYRPALFAPPWCDILAGNPQGTAAPLAPLLRKAIAAGEVSAELYTGAWTDVGTPQRLAALNA